MANEVAKAYVQIIPTATGFQGSLENILNDEANRAGRSAGNSFSNSFAGSASSAAAALSPVSNAARGVMENVISTSANFDEQMSKVQAISGAYGEDLETLRGLAMEMGRTTKYSAIEAGEALEYMGMAGWKSDQMISGLPGILNLAAAAGEDLGTTSDIVTDALTAFGLGAEDAGRFSDILAAASVNANTNVSMLGESFRYAASLSGSMKFSAEDVAVALGLMANTGIKSSQAGTALRNVMQRLAKPTKESAQAMEALGISIDDGHGNMLTFRDIMDQMRSSLGGLKYDQEEYNAKLTELNRQLDAGEISEKDYEQATEDLAAVTLKSADAQKAQYAAMLSGTYGLAGLLGIVNASEEDYQKLCDAIDNSSESMVLTKEGAVIPLSQALAEGIEYTERFNGTAEAMASVMQDNLNGRMKSLESRMESIRISLGDKLMPLLEKAADWAIKALDWFGGLNDGTQSLIVGVLGVTAVVTPVLSIVGSLAGGIGNLISLGGTIVTSVLPGIGAGLSGLSGSIAAFAGSTVFQLGLIGVSITEIIGGFRTLAEASKGYAEAENAHANETATAVDSYLKVYSEKGKEVADEWAAAVYALDTSNMTLDEAQKALTERIEGYWEDVPENIGEGFLGGLEYYFGGGGGSIGEYLSDAGSEIVHSFKNVLGISSPSTVFREIGENTVIGFQEGVDSREGALLSDMTGISASLVRSFDGVEENLSQIGMNMMTGLANGIISAASRAVQAVGNAAGSVINTVKNVFGIHSPSTVFAEIGSNLMSGMELGMEEGRNDALQAARSITSDVTVTAAAETAQPARVENSYRSSGMQPQRNLTVILELNRQQLGRAVYQLNNEETQRVGLKLSPQMSGGS